MKKVMVLMSTYNGEKYLVEQIESLLAQKDVELEIFVRDDGSIDETLEILDSYKSNILSYYCGENRGAAMSFIELVCKAGEADYYAYCDQDDVWYDDKLSKAIQQLEQCGTMSLYMSTYDVVDENLNFIKQGDMEFDRPYTLERTLVRGCPSGCTMVFDYRLKEIIARNPPTSVRMHDYWTLLSIEALQGSIITDNFSRIMYRQHENNTVGIIPSKKTIIQRLMKSAIKGNNERSRQATMLLSSYEDVLPEENKNKLEFVSNYRKKFSDRIRLAFDKDFTPAERRNRILFRISVLIGVF